MLRTIAAPMAPRAGLLALVVVAALAVSLLAACAPGGGGDVEGDTLSFYFGLPLRGESAPRERRFATEPGSRSPKRASAPGR